MWIKVYGIKASSRVSVSFFLILLAFFGLIVISTPELRVKNTGMLNDETFIRKLGRNILLARKTSWRTKLRKNICF